MLSLILTSYNLVPAAASEIDLPYTADSSVVEVPDTADSSGSGLPDTLSGEEVKKDTGNPVIDSLTETKEALEGMKPGEDYREDQAFVLTESRSEALRAARQYNGSLIKYEYGVGVIDLDKPYQETVEEILDDFNEAAEDEKEKKAPDIPAHPSIILRSTSYTDGINDDLYDDQWFHARINDGIVWNSGFTGNGAKVCIIDSGINPDCETYSNVAASMNFTDDIVDGAKDMFGHGSHVAGIVAAPKDGRGIVGVAPDAKLYIAKTSDNEGRSDLDSVICAWEWAIEQDVDIINMSIGAPLSLLTPDETKIYNDYMLKLRNKGIVPVASAGNYSTDELYFPACLDYVISVGATDESDALTSFSNYGDSVNIAAPGYNILSTYKDETYQYRNGTSQAAPVVAGTLALLHSAGKVHDTDNASEYYEMKARLRAVRTTSVFSYNGHRVRGGLDLSGFNGTPGEDFPDKNTLYPVSETVTTDHDDNDYYDSENDRYISIGDNEKYVKTGSGSNSVLIVFKKEVPYTRNKKAIARAVSARMITLKGSGLSIKKVTAKKPKKNASYTTVTIKLKGNDKAAKKTAKALNRSLKNIMIKLT